ELRHIAPGQEQEKRPRADLAAPQAGLQGAVAHEPSPPSGACVSNSRRTPAHSSGSSARSSAVSAMTYHRIPFLPANHDGAPSAIRRENHRRVGTSLRTGGWVRCPVLRANAALLRRTLALPLSSFPDDIAASDRRPHAAGWARRPDVAHLRATSGA